MKTFRRLPRSVLAAAAGVVSAGLLLGSAELVGVWFRPAASPLIAVGAAFIDVTPTWLKNFAVDTFGTADKAVLLVAMGAVTAILAALVGLLARRRWRDGAAAVLLLSGVLALAVITRSGAELFDLLPTAAGTVAGLAALRLLVHRLPPPGAASASDADPTPSRRSFFATAAVLTVAAAVLAASGSALKSVRGGIQEIRRALRLPAAAVPAKALPSGLESPVQGVAPFITPNADFYRIDTALAVPQVDPASWLLRVHGMVDEEFTLSFPELLELDLVESHVTLACVSNPVGGELAGNASWLGYPLAKLLDRARPLSGADMVLSRSADGFSASTPLEALRDGRDALLAVGMNGEPLPLEHGFPVRMVVPGLYGFVSATKWVVDLEVTRFQDKTAYWTDRGWSDRGPIKTASRIEAPRPFASVPAGDVAVGGTAWAQQRGIDRVEIQVDDSPWREAVLAAEASIDTWRQWSFSWRAEPGRHYLRVRAYDSVDGLQTPERADPIPNGASGWHSISVTVEP